MAKLGFGGFETNDTVGPVLGQDLDPGLTGTNVTYDSSVKRTGNFSGKCDSGAGGVAAACSTCVPVVAITPSSTVYAREYFNFTNLPASTVSILAPLSVISTGGAVKITSGGVVQLWDNTAANVQIGSDGPTLSTGTWYMIELAITLNASSLITSVEARVEGSSIASGSVTGVGAFSQASFSAGWIDAPGTSKVVNIDDGAINDSTGAANNTWCGSGGVVLLVPTGDSAKGTGWTNDAAGTTNFFDAVDNKPPVGIADTTGGSGLHQLRNATANANSSYDATMTTYTAAGVPAGATINAVLPFVVTAAPVTTSSKQGTVGVVSNPTIANVALDIAGTSGAFWSGSAAGTYATGWKGSRGTFTATPSVTLGTAPVMRITQVTSSTRIAMVCFMGIYVDYTPAVIPIPNVNMAPRIAA